MSQMRIVSNIAEKLRAMQRYNRLLEGKILVAAWHRILDLVGQTSVADFWITNVGILSPTHPSKPTKRTGRLIGSLIGARRFTAVKLPTAVERLRGKQATTSGIGFAKGKKESIRRVNAIGGQIVAEIGSEVPYAEELETSQRSYLRPAAADIASGDQAVKILKVSVEETFKDAHI